MELLAHLLKEYMLSEAIRQRTELEKQNDIEQIKDKLNLAIELGNEKDETQQLITLGNTYAYYSNFDLSDTMFRRALALARDLNDKYLEIVVLVNLGLLYKTRLDYQTAYSYYQKARRIAKEISNQVFESKIEEHITELNNLMDMENLTKGTT